MGRIRWGIIGAGTIAHRFAAALEHVDDAVLTAVSGRNPKRLAQFAREHSVDDGLCYSSAGDDGAAAHQRLIENPDIDAVYIALPHGMHAEWACRALRAGKSVLCEKPAVLSEAEALRIERAAHESKTLFMEAMKPRFTPARSCVRELVEGGELGAVLEMDVTHRLDYGSHLGGYLIDPLQGGTLYDLGCYGIGWIDDLLVGDAEVERVDVRWIDGAGGAPVDIAETARLCVGGVPVRLDFAGDSGDYNVECRIRCERGAIAVPRSRTSAPLFAGERQKVPSCRPLRRSASRESSMQSAKLGDGADGSRRLLAIQKRARLAVPKRGVFAVGRRQLGMGPVLHNLSVGEHHYAVEGGYR